MIDFAAVDRHIEENLEKSLAELSALVAQPSIAAQDLGMEPCAKLVAAMLARRGFKTELAPGGGPPVVLGERAGRTDRTLLVYNHYDVQPPEPLELWTSPPFEPTLRDGKLYARGAVDDKGQVYMHLKAIEAHMKVNGKLPINLKVVIEGEEEVGSESLAAFLREQRAQLDADVILV